MGPVVNSEEGITMMLAWARAHDIPLLPIYRKLARRYGVSTKGNCFLDPIPAGLTGLSAAMTILDGH